MSRQLAAIMVTDIEGYSDILQKDNTQAASISNQYRNTFNILTEKFHGKVLRHYGGGTLSIFNSAVDAVSCGIQLQLAFRKTVEIPVRIGIHSGDVTLREDEIAGDGVKIASSLGEFAEPGSVLISKQVYEEVKNHTEFKTTSLGILPIKQLKKRIGVIALTNYGLLVPERGTFRKRVYQKDSRGIIGKRVLWTAAILILAILIYGIYDNEPMPTVGSSNQKSIAVLPFVNLSNDPSQEYFSDGMTADLLSQLAKINDLRVVSRTSIMQYKNTDKSLRIIADELDATHILEGSIRKQNDQVRIAVNLIEASSDNRIWSVDFDRDIQDVLQVQREVSLEVVRLMKADLTTEEKMRVEKTVTANQEAYDFYQKGQNLIRRTEGTTSQLDEALRLFQHAINLDPGFSLAYVGLADTYLSYATWGRTPPSKAIPAARAAALRAQELDNELGECYEILGAIFLHEQQYQKANQYLQRAIDISPGHVKTYSWLAQLYLLQGDLPEAINYFRKAERLDPLSTSYTSYIIWAYYIHKQYDKAIEVAEESLQRYPTDSYTLWNLGNAYRGKKEYDKAIEIFRKRVIGTETNWALAYTYGISGQSEQAHKILDYHLEKAAREYVPSVMISAIYLGMNDHENAIIYLKKAFEEGIAPILLPEVLMGPMFEPLRKNPAFNKILPKTNSKQS